MSFKALIFVVKRNFQVILNQLFVKVFEKPRRKKYFSIFVEILYCTEMRNYVHFSTECCKKYWLYRKMLQTKVVNN